MKIIEIRNNLIKLSYNEDERPTLGQFIALTGEEKSYVAQFVNLKADNMNNFAVAKLMFSFSKDGVVSEYDGSTPSINSNIVPLPANELLSLLPVETPIKIGRISGCSDELNLDISLFEHNFTVFCENDYEKATVISNCVRQLFRMKEKSVIIDIDSIFLFYSKLSVGQDFKLPLNSDFIDFIFEHELKGVDTPTKAVIKDIFYAVQQYIKTLDDEFLSIESLIDVVTAQYKETQMPELALLKNKLLKYRDNGIFANEATEFQYLENKLQDRNCVVVNLKDIDAELQKDVITFIHKIIEKFDKYVYYFVPLTDDNSDKKLIKRLINHNHVFTTMFVSHSYKYASELKSHAQEVMFFAPQTMQNDFAAYNTFLNKLNPAEGVIYGKLTQGIPIIINLEDLELDLTKEDVFGDRQRFVPAIEEDVLTSNDIYAINNLQEAPVLEQDTLKTSQTQDFVDYQYEQDTAPQQSEALENYTETENENEENYDEDSKTIEPVENVLADDYDNVSNEVETATAEEVEEMDEVEEVGNLEEVSEIGEVETSDEKDDLSFMDDFASQSEEEAQPVQDFPESDAADQLTEDDLDFIENNQETQNDESDSSNESLSESEADDNPPVVPVYNTDEGKEVSGVNIGIKAGDQISHPRYGNGVVEKIIKYGNKTLCSIDFENVGRRLLDPSVSDFEKI